MNLSSCHYLKRYIIHQLSFILCKCNIHRAPGHWEREIQRGRTALSVSWRFIMSAAYFLQRGIKGMNDLQFCGIWDTGGHYLHMLCLLVITFPPRLMTGNCSLGDDESDQGRTCKWPFKDWNIAAIDVFLFSKKH